MYLRSRAQLSTRRLRGFGGAGGGPNPFLEVLHLLGELNRQGKCGRFYSSIQ